MGEININQTITRKIVYSRHYFRINVNVLLAPEHSSAVSDIPAPTEAPKAAKVEQSKCYLILVF